MDLGVAQAPKKRNMPRGKEGASYTEGCLACLRAWGGGGASITWRVAQRLEGALKLKGASDPGKGRVTEHM